MKPADHNLCLDLTLGALAGGAATWIMGQATTTHARGLAGHLVLGLATEGVMQVADRAAA